MTRCTCERASREAWNEAIEAAARESEIHGRKILARDIRALKKPVQGFRSSYDPPVSPSENQRKAGHRGASYREIETSTDGMPGLLK